MYKVQDKFEGYEYSRWKFGGMVLKLFITRPQISKQLNFVEEVYFLS